MRFSATLKKPWHESTEVFICAKKKKKDLHTAVYTTLLCPQSLVFVFFFFYRALSVVLPCEREPNKNEGCLVVKGV